VQFIVIGWGRVKGGLGEQTVGWVIPGDLTVDKAALGSRIRRYFWDLTGCQDLPRRKLRFLGWSDSEQGMAGGGKGA
jgi:hypothetical protein